MLEPETGGVSSLLIRTSGVETEDVPSVRIRMSGAGNWRCVSSIKIMMSGARNWRYFA